MLHFQGNSSIWDCQGLKWRCMGESRSRWKDVLPEPNWSICTHKNEGNSGWVESFPV